MEEISTPSVEDMITRKVEFEELEVEDKINNTPEQKRINSHNKRKEALRNSMGAEKFDRLFGQAKTFLTQAEKTRRSLRRDYAT